jgi:hypothetical protein
MSVSSIIESLVAAGKAYENNEPGARETLIDSSRALVTSLEIPSEFLQRSFWAEVSPPPPRKKKKKGENHVLIMIDSQLSPP